jgi:N-acetylneuraminic acid mutarotase
MTSNISTRVDIYDASNNSWSTTEMLEGKSNMASAVFNEKIFWAGGLKPGGGSSNQVEIRNVNTGVSSLNCIIPRTDFGAVTKDDNIIFFTGSTSDFSLFGNQFEIFNTTTGTWSTGRLNQNIIYSTIISVNDTIYVAGGYINGGLSNQV